MMIYILKLHLISKYKLIPVLNLTQELNNTIRDINNFPKKGITFKDITPILKNPVLDNQSKKYCYC